MPVQATAAQAAADATVPQGVRERAGRSPADPPRALPVQSLAVGFAALIMATPVIALTLGWALGWPEPVTQGVIVGGWVALLVSGLAILALRPTRPRPMADWTVLWLGATTIRILFTPLGLLSVYFAAPLPGTAVLLGGLAAYLAALAVESSILALFAARAVPPPDSLGSAVDDGEARS